MAKGDTAKLAVKLTLDGADSAARAIGVLSKSVGAMGRGFSKVNSNLFYLVNNFRTVAGLATSAGRAMHAAFIAPNIKFDDEIEALQFLGLTAAQAREKLAGLFATAGTLDMPRDKLVAAHAALYRFGGDALATAANLKLVSDTSKYSGREIAEVAQAYGMFYSKLRRGKDVEPALRQIFSLGILSDDAAEKLENLAAYGKDADTIFRAFADSVRQTVRHVGQADRTYSDTTRRIADLFGEFRRQAGEPLFQSIKKDLEGLTGQMEGAFDSGRMQGLAKAIGQAMAAEYGLLKTALTGTLKISDILDAAEAGKIADAINRALATSAENFIGYMRELADKYGPDIAMAFLPKRLRNLLGADQSKAVKDMAEKGITPENWEKIGHFGRVTYMAESMKAGGIPGWLANFTANTPFAEGFTSIGGMYSTPEKRAANTRAYLDAVGEHGYYKNKPRDVGEAFRSAYRGDPATRVAAGLTGYINAASPSAASGPGMSRIMETGPQMLQTFAAFREMRGHIEAMNGAAERVARNLNQAAEQGARL